MIIRTEHVNVTPGTFLVANIRQFMTLLRRSGFRLGLDDTLLAERTVSLVGISQRSRMYQALAAVCVKSREETIIFDQAFGIFWQSHGKTALDLLAEQGIKPKTRERSKGSRVWESLLASSHAETKQNKETHHTAALSWSREHILQHKDFAAMSREEFAKAQLLIQESSADLPHRRQRRWVRSSAGSLDWQREIKLAARQPWSMAAPRRISRRLQPWPLITLLDISGSMESYSRIFLHYIHTLAQIRQLSSEAFVFSTHMVRITSWLQEQSADEALARLGQDVDIWEGGTNIGRCLKDFLDKWRKRLLYRPCIVLFVSDGLDRASGDELDEALIELKRTGARLLWLNPLLRYDGYQALAGGASRLQKHADGIGRIHSLHCLQQLSSGLWKQARRQAGCTN